MPISVAVENLGCRVNRVESDRMVRDLAAAGFTVADAAEAQVVVINTCAVTGEAEAKTRKAVRHALGLPQAPRVIATGCAANLHAADLAALSDRVTVEPLKTAIAARVRSLMGAPGAISAQSASAPAPAQPGPEQVRALLGRTRLGIKVQDGCDNRCTYCIVWKARGASRSVAADEVVAEVRRAEAAGVPEVVLTGVNLGRYQDGEDGNGVALDGLLARILAETGIEHVRLSSIEPPEVTPALIDVVAASAGRVAPFFHMPLQSGCTATLKRMGRLYTAEGYARVAEQIRAQLPQAALSCDVIVGFPGEDEAEFQESLAFCRRMGFARMHVFRYSPRPGTVAAAAPDQVPPQVKAERSAAMRAAAAELARADAEKRVGTAEYAVIEAEGAGTLASFHRVRVAGAKPGALVRVALESVDDEGVLVGRPCR